MYIDVFSKWKCAVNLCFFVSEWVSLELGLRFFSSCNGSTATVFFESKLFEVLGVLGGPGGPGGRCTARNRRK